MLPYNDTVAAVATPLFRGGIGIIRISGPDAFDIADAVFDGKTKPSTARTHTALYGYVRDPESGKSVDEALCLVMRSPNSYTGEDVAELSVHGSPLLLQQILDIIFSCGARQAEPGEFTYRAYMNGRLSLTQAEAVQSIVNSQSDAGLRNAFLQLQGSLRDSLKDIRNEILEMSANFEADIEFPEEGLNLLTKEQAFTILENLTDKISEFLDSYALGKKIEEGLRIVICGPPNSGKSTLLNRLLNEDRAIVHSLPGTT
ncbi:tRNA modification GTPase, partial [candidate division KSB1 bacterium]